ncbi:MAG: hypothetical protein IKI31_02080, partial [Treponema sp.]|nr:hypothetical protein [Treponema sp.]
TTAKRLKRNLIFFAFFKISPPVFRKFIYQNGNYRGNISSSHWETVIGNYSPLDLLPELTTCNATKGLYACFVNELTHTSAFFQAPDYTPVGEVINYGTSKYFDNDVYHCNIAAFKRLSEFFDFLKKHDCYDNTRIIIVSDHGGDYNIRSKKFEKENNLDKKVTAGFYVGRGYYNPLLLVKDFHKMNSLEEDNRFMTNADVPSLLLKDIVENPVNPFTKKPLLLDTTELKQNGVIITTNDDFAADDHSKNTFYIKDNEWWQVKDNVFKEENWKQIPSPIKN